MTVTDTIILNERISDPAKFTLNDLHLAGVYWPILMTVAKLNQHRAVQEFTLIQYADLVNSAKQNNLNDPVVARAINVSIGKKLDPINWFCRENGLPNLTCLAVDAQGKPGDGYMRNNNWEAEKAEVAAYDWRECDLQFNQVLKERAEIRIRKQARQRREQSEQKALEDLFIWWKPLKARYPNITQEQKGRMVELIRGWVPVEEAAAAVLGE